MGDRAFVAIGSPISLGMRARDRCLDGGSIFVETPRLVVGTLWGWSNQIGGTATCWPIAPHSFLWFQPFPPWLSILEPPSISQEFPPVAAAILGVPSSHTPRKIRDGEPWGGKVTF